MYYITCDVDWAPEVVIEDFLSLLEEHNVKCTVFATHRSHVLQSCNSQLFEIGLHPNYNPLLNGVNACPRDQIIPELLNIYPNATGVRSHSLVQSSVILQDFVDNGLTYDVNQFMPYQKIDQPYKWFNGLTRVKYNWEDDIHFLLNRKFDDLGLDPNSRYNILDFHPIHVYLNTHSIDLYNSAKLVYHDHKELLRFRNHKELGTRDIFINTLKTITYSETIGQMVEKSIYEDSNNR